MSHAGGSRSRRRRARRRRGPRTAAFTAGAVIVVAAAAFAGRGYLAEFVPGHGGGRTADASATSPAAPPPSTPAPKPSASTSSPTSSPSASPHRTRGSDAVDPHATFPANGPGTFRTAAVSGTRVGTRGRLFRYEVKVEDGLAQTPSGISSEVRRVFSDPRGWTARGAASFQQVASGAHDFTVVVAAPGTVDRICGRGGLDTGGEVNCRVGKNVVVNVKRWLLASPYYQNSLSDYHALTINHEVGHFLGHGHASCPGPGRPAPVMMQQIKGLHGCTANPWPYDRSGRYLTGPATA